MQLKIVMYLISRVSISLNTLSLLLSLPLFISSLLEGSESLVRVTLIFNCMLKHIKLKLSFRSGRGHCLIECINHACMQTTPNPLPGYYSLIFDHLIPCRIPLTDQNLEHAISQIPCRTRFSQLVSLIDELSTHCENNYMQAAFP